MSNKERVDRGNLEPSKIKWKTDFDKDVIVDNFINRKWTEIEEEDGNINQLITIFQMIRRNMVD